MSIMIRALFLLIASIMPGISVAESEFEALFDGDRALTHIYQQVSFGPRTLDNPSAKAETLSFIASYLKPLATKLTIQKFSNNGSHSRPTDCLVIIYGLALLTPNPMLISALCSVLTGILGQYLTKNQI